MLRAPRLMPDVRRTEEMNELKSTDMCYMCHRAASTREHVPPSSFFPPGKRTNLWRVPSCSVHNLDNSKDVEYVRNVISIQHGTNATAEEVFQVGKRSFDRSPALFQRTFQDIQGVIVDGDEVGIFSFDLPRVKTVMSTIAHALAYRDFGRDYIGEWRILCATLHSKTPAPKWDHFRQMLMAASFEPVATPEPEVFAYGIHGMHPIGFIYRLVFYQAFIVFAWPVMKGGA